MSSKALFRRLSRFMVVAATSSVVLASGAGMSAAYASSSADHSQGTTGTSGTYNTPQPLSNADQNTGGANGQCPGGPYCSTRDGSPSGNGNQTNGGHTGEPCAGCVGKADNKNPKGQMPNGSDHNAGYECDRNHGIGRSNPAHTGCTTPPPGQPTPLTLSGTCTEGGSAAWTLTNPNTTDIAAHYVSGSTAGDVTVLAGKTVTLPVTGTSVTVTFPNTTLASITKSVDNCPPPATQLKKLTLTVDCSSTAGSYVWTLLNPNDVAVPAHWTAGSASGDVTVPANGSATFTTTTRDVTVSFAPALHLADICMKAPNCPTTPPSGCSETVLFDAMPASGSTVKPGDTVSALYQDETAIGSTGAFAPALTIDGVVQPAGALTVAPQAGSHHDTLLSFVIPAAYGDGATHTFAITAYDTDQNKPGGDCGTFTWTLKVNPPVLTQTLAGHIYDCTTGTATTTEVTGGTLSATGPTTVASHANPLPATPVDAGTYTLTGTAPAGYQFVSCDVNGTPSQTTVVVPAGENKEGDLYVAQITQTVSGVIELCNGDMAPSTGSLLTVESTLAHSTNPLAATPVAAGNQTVDAVAPTGYHFVNCNASTQTIQTPGTATETVNVPAGGTNQAVFYVEKNETPPPPPVLSMTVDKTNNADGDTVFSKSETAPATGATVPFQVVISNTSTAVEVIDSISDAYSAVTAAECPDLIGAEIQPGHSVTCSFSIEGYAPPAGTSLTNTVTVTVHAKGDTGDTLTGTSTSTVTTAAPPPPVLTVNVDKTNNADGVEGFHKTETATSAGQSVPFQVVISNPTGTDEVIDSITDAYASTSASECADLIGTTLAAHTSVTCTFTIAGYSPAAGGSLTDTVTVVVHQLGNTGNSTSGESSSTVLTPATPPALSLTVVKSNDANVDGVFHDTESAKTVGQDVTFQVSIVNNSPVALVIDSVVDAFSGATHPECASLLNTTLASGATATCSFTVAGYSPAAGSSLTDLVTVIGHEVSNPGNSTQGSDTSTVLTPSPVAAGAPDLAIVKTASKTSVTPGDAFSYTLTVTNVGDAATTGAVTVTDVVPSGLSVTGADGGTAWTCSVSGQTVTCTYTAGTITPGTTVAGIIVSTTVLSSASGTLTNTGVVKTPGDTNPTNDTSTVKTPVTKVLGEKIPQTPGTPGTPGTPSTPSVSPTVLPMTGSDVTALLPLALGFMTVGLLLMVAGVRRRRA